MKWVAILAWAKEFGLVRIYGHDDIPCRDLSVAILAKFLIGAFRLRLFQVDRSLASKCRSRASDMN